MIRWFLIVALFAVLQISSPSESEEYFVGERNGKNYTIAQYNGDPDSDNLTLIVREPNGIFREFLLSTCTESSVEIRGYNINSEGSYLFLFLWQEHGNDCFVTVNLTSLSNNTSNGNCMSIKGAYFGKHKVYVYRAMYNNILVRQLVTPEGELTNPVVVVQTESLIRKVDVSVDSMHITARGKSVTFKDAPKCDVPEVEDSKILKRWLLTPEGKEINPVVITKTESRIRKIDVSVDSINITAWVNSHSSTFKDAPKCDVPENDISCTEYSVPKETPDVILTGSEYFVAERNGKNYIIKRYDGYPTRLELNVNESGGIIKKFSLSTCFDQQTSIKNYSINSQGSHLFFHIRNIFGNNYLVTVDLKTLSNDTPNGECVYIGVAYFGKHKIYVYRVEDRNILVRQLVTPEGELTNPIVIAKIESEIRKIDVSVNSTDITTGGDIYPITFKDAPKCDVPENDTSCTEYYLPGKMLDFTSPIYKYFVGECNGTHYNLTAYREFSSNKSILVLSVKKPNNIVKNFRFTHCSYSIKEIKNYSINSQGTHLFIHVLYSFDDNYFITVDLRTLSNDTSDGNCMFINAAYFGKHKIYVYRTMDRNVLVRQLMTPEGELANLVVVAKIESEIRKVDVSVDSINLTVWVDVHPITFKDAPKCDVPEACRNDTSCKEYSTPKVMLDAFLNSTKYFIGEQNGKNYTIKKYKYSVVHDTTLVLNVNGPSGIVQTFPLSSPRQLIKEIKNYSINSQGTHLFIYGLSSSDNNYLITVDLTALSDNILNGNCMSIKGAYFGKHKIYVYRVEDSNTLKRWLVTPEGELTNPVVVVQTESSIKEVDVSVDSINITAWVDSYSSTFKDTPKCDVPDDGTPCNDDKVPEEKTQVPLTTEQTNTEPVETTISTKSSTSGNLNTNARATKRRRHIASTAEKTTVKSGDNSIVKPSEYDLNIGVIAIGAFIFVLVMILIGYFIFNSRSNSKRKPQNNPNKGSGNRKLIMKNSPQDKDCKVPMIA
ncbi:hypothetical protein FO519_008582 [Halicephalobus sp. NKZ332]|nr:hypothetical protein FO519_008582 [Halicephalobus sp. NKZ332]